MDETFTKKISKNKYMTYDRNGNKAYGSTKESAENQYNILYRITRSPIIGTIDMSQYNINL